MQIEQFLEYLHVVKNVSSHTLRSYKTDLQTFATFLGGKPLSVVDRFDVRAFLLHLFKQGLKKPSVARRASALRSFYRFLVKHSGLASSPMDLIDPLKQDSRIPRAVTLEEIEHFFSLPDLACPMGLRDRAILELFYSSGLRVSELSLLNCEDLSKEEGLVRVIGKGNKERIVPVTLFAIEWIERYRAVLNVDLIDKKALFVNRLGTRLTTRSIDRLFKNYLLKSGLSSRITPHVLRHSIATHLLERGMGLKSIQEILGHSSPSTTQIYTKVNAKLKKEAYQKAHPLEKDHLE